MNCKITNWNIKILNKDENLEKLVNYTKISEKINISFSLDLSKNKYSLIEKFVYDIAVANFKNLNINNIDDKGVTFWFKSKQVCCSDCISFHIDKDEYYNGYTNYPLLTNITYLNNNYNPTLITNISDLNYINNTNIYLSFPEELKNISFEAGNFFHGECSISENYQKNIDRNIIVISLWDNPVKHIPFFDYDQFLYLYHLNINTSFKIDEQFNKKNKIVEKFDIDYDNKCIKIELTQNYIINKKMLFEILSNNDTKNLYKLSNYCNKYIKSINNFCFLSDISKEIDETNILEYKDEKVDNFIKDIEITNNIQQITNSNQSDVNIFIENINEKNKDFNEIKNDIVKTELLDNNFVTSKMDIIIDNEKLIDLQKIMDCNLNTWDLEFNSLNEMENNIINDIIDLYPFSINNNMFFINKNKNKYNILEKIVVDIGKFHLNKNGIELDDNINISFEFYSNNQQSMHIDTKNNYGRPFISSVTYLNSSINPTIITSIDNNSYKFKKFENENLFISFPSKMKHISYDGGNYFHLHNFNLNNNNFNEQPFILIVYIWNIKLDNILYYKDRFEIQDSSIPNINDGDGNGNGNGNSNGDDIFFDKNSDDFVLFKISKNNAKIIELHNDLIINDTFFDNILYRKSKNIFRLNKLFENKNFKDFHNFIIIKLKLDDIKEKKTKIENDDCNILSKIKFNTEIFANHYIFNNICSIDDCLWIIRDYNEYKLSISENIILNDSIINIENIKSIFEFILKNVSNKIIDNIKTFIYKGGKNSFNFENIFISDTVTTKIYKDNSNKKYSFFGILYINNNNYSTCDITVNNNGKTNTHTINNGDIILYDNKINFTISNPDKTKIIILFFINII